ncbi:EthD family reductase [Phenylobacterium sp.]|jgi:uncharacterized protein (TIGR02118 family)|uniref:EthD family reductase n=1 Tax=Phenylobacterium sp. TaxID=1871053 RepID=UPI002E316FB6|nr:EthD family reductase [Phenylobacterium sp.]HEX3367913.1 EthD family reductase [Phenylobacterium sp.]
MPKAGPASALSRRSALALALAGGAAAIASPAWAVGAVKHYILVELLPGYDQLILDRWYMTFHSQQVRRAFKAWQRNYISFRAYLPPAEATARYPIQYGRMTEIQFDSLADFRETRPHNIYGGLESFTPPPGGWQDQKLFKAVTATIPVNPNELFVSLDTPPKEIPYFRWIIFFKYPKGMTEEAGDAWYRNVHAEEMAKVPGLKRYGLYKAVTETAPYPRVAELWFDDYASWKKAFLPAPKFTPPPSGGAFPFFETISMFVGENPDVDFVNDKRSIP